MTQQQDVVLAEIQLPAQNATIGMTFCPGKPDAHGEQGSVVENDIEAIKQWGADAIISLVNDKEMSIYKVEDLGEQITKAGMQWFHHPFEDGGVPCNNFRERWQTQREKMLAILNKGGKVMVHCRGGKGRTGLIVAQLMLELGIDFDHTVSEVQNNRKGALNKEAHIEYLKSI